MLSPPRDLYVSLCLCTEQLHISKEINKHISQDYTEPRNLIYVPNKKSQRIEYGPSRSAEGVPGSP